MIRRYRVERHPYEEPKLIRKNPEQRPVSYNPRQRVLLIVISLLLAFVLALLIMPSGLKKDALKRTIQEQKAFIKDKLRGQQKQNEQSYLHNQ